jgi:ABC-type transport system, involved in lipoprotein release, permease component
VNFEFFIAKRLTKRTQGRLSRPIVIIATLSIMLGSAVMILSVFVLQGFKKEIKEKVVGFSSHIQIVPYDYLSSQRQHPIILSPQEISKLKEVKNIKTISPFCTKGCVIKTKDDFQGIALKGIEPSQDDDFFKGYLVSGRFINYSDTNEVVISKSVADKLCLRLGDKMRAYFFVDNTYKARALKIVGIYSTGLSIYDEKFALCSMRLVQGLNGWTDNQVEGWGVWLKDYSLIAQSTQDIYAATDRDKDALPVQEMDSTLFTWLDLLDSNVVVIMVIMILVSIITITSTLLIIIFENTHTIGMLKSFGATSAMIMKIFLYNAGYIVLKGLIYGNLLAGSLAWLQKQFSLFALDQQSYYLSSVPIDISLWQIVLIDVATIIICLVTLLIPLRSITKISPLRSISFE